MKLNRWLLVIFIITLASRLTIAFLIPTFTYDSYFHLRQVDQITETGLPLFIDDLSYGGRVNFFLPTFHYLAAFFNIFLPLDMVAKILPNLLISLIVIITFFTAKKLTDNLNGSLLAAFVAGFLPITFFTNTFTPLSLFLPLVFFTIYSFTRLKSKKFLLLYMLSFVILSLTSPATVLLLVGFLIYLLLALVEKKRVPKSEKELMIFSLFTFLWIQFLFYKDTFLNEGIQFIWKNVPVAIMAQYFPNFSILQSIVLVSAVPFLAGIYIVYRSLFQWQGRNQLLMISLVVSTTMLAWLRFIQFDLSLSFFGIVLAILMALFYQDIKNYFKDIKLNFLRKHLTFLFATMLLLTIIPATASFAFSQETPSQKDVNAFSWLKNNTPESSGVLSTIKEGHMVTYHGERKNIMDSQFNLIGDVEERFKAVKSLYSTGFTTQAIGLLNQYGVNYLILSERSQKQHNLTKFP